MTFSYPFYAIHVAAVTKTDAAWSGVQTSYRHFEFLHYNRHTCANSSDSQIIAKLTEIMFQLHLQRTSYNNITTMSKMSDCTATSWIFYCRC